MTSSPLPSRIVSSRRALAAAAVGVAALVAGCGTSTTTVTVTSTPSAPSGTSSPTTPATTPVSSPAQPSTPPGPAACATRDLRAKLGLSQGALGSTYIAIEFKNIGTAACTLYGYPGVSLAGGNPIAQIGQAADENQATPRQLVTLAPGAVANALLRIVDAHNYPASRCHPVPSTYLQIFPPNQTTPIYLAYSTTACVKPRHLLTVDVVKPGSGG